MPLALTARLRGCGASGPLCVACNATSQFMCHMHACFITKHLPSWIRQALANLEEEIVGGLAVAWPPVSRYTLWQYMMLCSTAHMYL